MQRNDLVLEFSGNLDANGSYISDWLDSADINSVRVAATNSAVNIETSTDTVNSVGLQYTGTNAPVTDERFIAARYFRVVVGLGSSWSNAAFAVSVRRAS